MITYYEFINEKYDFEFTGNEYGIYFDKPLIGYNYEFSNKDNKFLVYFRISDANQKIYVKDYYVYTEYGWESFIELNTYDAIGITKTIVEIILNFIKRFDPNQIIIEHIPTKKEEEKFGNMLHDIWREKHNKRSLLSKMYIEESLPIDYFYELKGSTSYITKDGFVRK